MDKKKKEVILYIIFLSSAILLFLDLIQFKIPFQTAGGIEDNSFVLAVGIDKADSKDNKYKITTISEKFSAEYGESSSINQKAEDIFTAEGDSIFEAVRGYNIFKSKGLEWGHINYIIISEEVAKEDILSLIDFFLRDHELRFNAKVLVVKDSSAEAFIRSGKKIGRFLPDLLDCVYRNEEKNSVTNDVDLVELARILDDKYVDLYLPCISLVARENDEVVFKKLEQTNKKNNEQPKNNDDEKNLEANTNKEDKEKEATSASQQKEESKGSSGSQGQQSNSQGNSESEDKVQYYVAMNGFAIFKDTKLIGYIEETYARGLNWIKGNIKTGALVLEDIYGENVTVEILKEDIENKIKYNGDMPEVTYRIHFETNISEIDGQIDVANEEANNLIERKQNEKIKEEIETIVKYAQENGVDIFNLSDLLYKKNPNKWNKIKENWDEVFKNMKISIDVKSKLSRTYHIRQPIRSGYGEKK
jgi:Ger(x)C family germination protein